MTRIGWKLLMAYAGVISLLAAWLGCRLFIYHRLLASELRAKSVGAAVEVSFAAVLENVRFGVSESLTESVDVVAFTLGNIEFSRVALIAVMILVCCLGIPQPRRRSLHSLAQPPAQD